MENLQPRTFLKNKDQFLRSTRINLLCAHFYEYWNANIHENFMLQNLPNVVICILTYPITNNLAIERMTKGPWIKGVPYLPEDDIKNYSILGMKNFNKNGVYGESIESTHIFEINTDIFFGNNFDYIREQILHNLGIVLSDKCRKMHKLWTESVNNTIDSSLHKNHYKKMEIKRVKKIIQKAPITITQQTY